MNLNNMHPDTYILLKHSNGSLKLLLFQWVNMDKLLREGYIEVCRGDWKECSTMFDAIKS